MKREKKKELLLPTLKDCTSKLENKVARKKRKRILYGLKKKKVCQRQYQESTMAILARRKRTLEVKSKEGERGAVGGVLNTIVKGAAWSTNGREMQKVQKKRKEKTVSLNRGP